MSGKYDYNIDGVGLIREGSYQKIDISGAGKAIGEVEAEDIIVSGTLKTESIKCNSLLIDGSYKAFNNTAAKSILVNGMGKFIGLSTDNLEVNGYSKIDESLFFNKVRINGTCKVEKKCEGTEFIADGVINIGDMLSADNIKITVRDKCIIKEIGGERITIKAGRHKSRRFLGFNFRNKPILYCDVIEGDEIFLENTKCNIVRGYKVIIGKGCTIEKIEYKTGIEVNEGSWVGTTMCI